MTFAGLSFLNQLIDYSTPDGNATLSRHHSEQPNDLN